MSTFPMVINQEQPQEQKQGLFSRISDALGITSLVDAFKEAAEQTKTNENMFKRSEIEFIISCALDDCETPEQTEQYFKDWLKDNKYSSMDGCGKIAFEDIKNQFDAMTEHEKTGLKSPAKSEQKLLCLLEA